MCKLVGCSRIRLSDHGYKTEPTANDARTDLIQSISFHRAEEMIQFAQMIQKQSPIDSYVTPEPSSMPG